MPTHKAQIQVLLLGVGRYHWGYKSSPAHERVTYPLAPRSMAVQRSAGIVAAPNRWTHWLAVAHHVVLP